MTHRHRSAGHGRATLVTTRRFEGQRGASLVIALAMLLILGVLLSAVLAYANTNFRVSNTYRKQRVDRYAGDGAVEAAINYVRGQGLMGRDPDYAATDPPCVYNVPTDAGAVAVTCRADPGQGSGLPTDTGLVPNQAILATGARQTEVGPLNQTQCDTFLGFGREARPEDSIYFNQGQIRGYFEEGSLTPCAERNRTLAQFTVRGNIVAAGRVSGKGSIAMQPTLVGTTSTPSSLKARFGCSIPFSPGACGTPTAAEYADPGAWSGGQATTAWRNVPLPTTNRTIMGVTVGPTITTGYRWNGNGLVPTAACGARDTIILLPGYYPNANTVNQFTSNPACKESTIWMAPDAGADNVLMTDDDKTGAFYFGFTNNNTDWDCSDLSDRPHRLCIGGGSADSSPRVVAGTPDGWNPLAVAGSTTPRTVVMGTAQTIDSGLSRTWYNAGGAREIGTSDNASPARYQASVCFFGVCFSSNRSIRLRDFAPQVAQGPDASANLIKIEVSHRETGTTDEPRVELRTVSPESGNRTCPGLYRLPRNTTGALRVDELTYTSDGTAPTAAKAQAAAAACLDSADRINGLQMTFRWTGNELNAGTPQVFLDGARVSFQSTPGASFPVAGAGGPAAIIDCDKTKAGAQLIFGGDSNAYVPDGSLEVCAGPYPTSPGDHQQIAVYGRPAVPALLGTGTPAVSAFENADNVSGSDMTNARDIAEVPTRQDATVSFRSTNSCSGFCAWTRQYSAVTRTTMQAYNAADYPGLELDNLTARVTYNSKNTNAFEFIETNNRAACRAWVITKLVLSFGFAEGTNCANSALRIGSCTRDAPMTATLRSWDVDVTGCVTQAQLESGVQTEWVSRADHLRFCAFFVCGDFGSKTASQQLDGVELLPGLRRSSGSTAIVPQSGCINDYPNYWEGVGSDDCAIIKADSLRPNNLFTNEADWVGRLSIQGTVYAPSAAFEIDELDSAYSLASRGLVVRHLRVKGFRNRPGYVTPVIDTQLDNTPAPREATFVACKRAAGRETSTTMCSKADGDRILTKARVRFEYAIATPTNWTPKVVWWTDNR